MPDFVYLIYAVLFGIVQGITEWLPVSSTGHMILLDSLLGARLDESVLTPLFKETFDVVIQFGSVLAVALLYFRRLNPFSLSKTKKERRGTLGLWGKILVASIPAGAVGFLFDGILSETVFREPYSKYVIAASLFIYGVLFIIVEKRNEGRDLRITEAERIDCKTALGVGAFQALALIPGTSRSGSTIIGSAILGVSRGAAAEFSFFLAIPVMLGASALKIAKSALAGVSFTPTQLVILATGSSVSFLVSLAAVKFLVGFVRRHSFAVFGYYRIALAAAVVIYFALIK